MRDVKIALEIAIAKFEKKQQKLAEDLVAAKEKKDARKIGELEVSLPFGHPPCFLSRIWNAGGFHRNLCRR